MTRFSKFFQKIFSDKMKKSRNPLGYSGLRGFNFFRYSLRFGSIPLAEDLPIEGMPCLTHRCTKSDCLHNLGLLHGGNTQDSH